jgi:hypothetical protein
VTNDESSPRDNEHLEDKHDRGEQRDPAQPHPRQPSMLKNLLITATVASIFGVLGAMGYSHLFGSKSGDPSSSQSKTEAGSSQESSSKTKSDGGPNTDSANASSNGASTSSAIPGSSSAKEADELKQQIMNLNQRIDRFGEQVDRIQQLLSLAVPLLQRIAPKN